MTTGHNKVTTNMTEQQKLLPCPFCGSEDVEHTVWGNDNWNRIICEECGVEQDYFRSAEAALAWWNTRSALGAELEALRYKAELYDEVFQLARDMEYLNVTTALDMLRREAGTLRTERDQLKALLLKIDQEYTERGDIDLPRRIVDIRAALSDSPNTPA